MNNLNQVIDRMNELDENILYERYGGTLIITEAIRVLARAVSKLQSPQPLDDLRTTTEAEADRQAALARQLQLRREVDRHRTKLNAAERRLEALEALPGDDPFVDGAALRFDVLRRDLGRTLTYVTLRAGGFWYSTGIKGTAGHRTRWADLIDWWIDHEVTEVTLLEPGETISLHTFTDLPPGALITPGER